MVLPGMRGDIKTPGGMPDSGSVNPGGPMPSVPQNRGQSMGQGSSALDPGKLEELFTQYTSGQMSREDLINQLHTFSEGQGGILGLLEEMDTTPDQGVMPESGFSPMPGGQGPAGPAGPMPSSMPQQPTAGRNAMGEEIPPLEEPLDARHQHISRLLQEYGLEPHDADHMSTVLNPHVEGHKRVYMSEDDTWMDVYNQHKLTEEQKGNESFGNVYAGTTLGESQAKDLTAWDEKSKATTGTSTGGSAQEMEAQAGLGEEFGQIGFGSALKWTGKDASGADTYDYDKIGDWNSAKDSSGNWDPQAKETFEEGGTSEFAGGHVDANEFDSATWAKGQDWYKDQVADVNPDPQEDIIPGFTSKWDQSEFDKIAGYMGTLPSTIGGELNEQEVLPVPPIVPGEAPIGKPNPFETGMPQGYGFEHLDKFHQHGKDTEYKRFIDDDGVGWPSQQAYNKFQSDLKLAAPDSPVGESGKPIIWTAGGPRGMEFVGWGKDSEGTIVPRFGIDGHTVAGVPMRDGKTYYFSTKEDLDRFSTTGMMPDGQQYSYHSNKILPKVPDGFRRDNQDMLIPIPIPAGAAPKTRTATTLDTGHTVVTDSSKSGDSDQSLIQDGTGNIVGVVNEDGTFTYSEAPITPSSQAPGDLPVNNTQNEVMQALQLGGHDTKEFPVLMEAIASLTSTLTSPLTEPQVAETMLTVIAQLEANNSQLSEQTRREIYALNVDGLNRKAELERQNLDRALQSGALTGSVPGVSDTGEILEIATLAKKAEDAARVFEAAAMQGQIPVWDKTNEEWTLQDMPKDAAGIPGFNLLDSEGNIVPGQQNLSLEARMFAQNQVLTEADKLRNYEISLTSLFGQYIAPGTSAEEASTLIQQTLESQKFGLTQLIAQSEVTGKIPKEWAPGGQAGFSTMAAKRFALEQDLKEQDLRYKVSMVNLESDRVDNDRFIEENKVNLQRHISNGELAEAVEARKDQTWLASERLRLDRDKMRLDVLTSLTDPASFLMAKRYGLLDDIGLAMGIDFGDDVIAELPPMINPNEIPTMQEYYNASESERRIILAEMASLGGFTTEAAARRIYDASPGSGRNVRRPSVLSVTR